VKKSRDFPGLFRYPGLTPFAADHGQILGGNYQQPLSYLGEVLETIKAPEEDGLGTYGQVSFAQRSGETTGTSGPGYDQRNSRSHLLVSCRARVLLATIALVVAGIRTLVRAIRTARTIARTFLSQFTEDQPAG